MMLSQYLAQQAAQGEADYVARMAPVWSERLRILEYFEELAKVFNGSAMTSSAKMVRDVIDEIHREA